MIYFDKTLIFNVIFIFFPFFIIFSLTNSFYYIYKYFKKNVKIN